MRVSPTLLAEVIKKEHLSLYLLTNKSFEKRPCKGRLKSKEGYADCDKELNHLLACFQFFIYAAINNPKECNNYWDGSDSHCYDEYFFKEYINFRVIEVIQDAIERYKDIFRIDYIGCHTKGQQLLYMKIYI